MAKTPDLQVTIQRRIMGDRIELEKLPGFWIKPKKFSMEGGERISALQFKMSKQARANPVTAKYVKKLNESGIIAPTIKDITEILEPEELQELLAATGSVTEGEGSEFNLLVMEYGIGEHNFKRGGKGLNIEDAISILKQDAEAVQEIINIILKWNVPLTDESSEKSETQSSGSAET